jgi:hypothetical protein
MEMDIVRTSVGVAMVYFKKKHLFHGKTRENLNITKMVGARLRVHPEYITSMGSTA